MLRCLYLDKGCIDCYIDTIGGVVWQSQKVQRLFVQGVGGAFTSRLYALQPQSIVQHDANTMTEKRQQESVMFVRSAARSFLAGKPNAENIAHMSAAIWREARRLKDSVRIVANRLKLSSQKRTFAALGNVVLRVQKLKYGQQEESNLDSAANVEKNSGVSRHRYCGAVVTTVLVTVMHFLSAPNFRRQYRGFITRFTGMKFDGQCWSGMGTLAKSAALLGVDFTFITSLKSVVVETRTQAI